MPSVLPDKAGGDAPQEVTQAADTGFPGSRREMP